MKIYINVFQSLNYLTDFSIHGLLPTSIRCFKIFLEGPSTWGRGGGALLNLNFFYVKTQIFQRKRKVHLTNCLETNFHNISNISLRVIRHRNYS